MVIMNPTLMNEVVFWRDLPQCLGGSDRALPPCRSLTLDEDGGRSCSCSEFLRKLWQTYFETKSKNN